MRSRHISIVSASIGAGHDGAAGEIARRLTALGYPVRRLDFLELLPGRLGPVMRRAYAAELAVAPRTWGWLLDTVSRGGPGSVAAEMAIQLSAVRTRAALGTDCSVVVSTYPLASQVLGHLRGHGALAAPVVTFLTDMSVHPLWVAPGVDLHLALHAVPARQAAGHGATVRVTSAAVAPPFHPHRTVVERERTRRRLGIDTHQPAALVVAGSWGVGDVAETMRDIASTGVAVPVAVCGENTRLRHRLARSGAGVALGWVDDMASLMRSCDVVVQNAGGLTSLEAMACGVPVVSYRCLPGHGVGNALALAEAGLAAWAHDLQSLAVALRDAMPGGRTARLAHDLVTGRHRRDDPAQVIAALAGPPGAAGVVATQPAPGGRSAVDAVA